MDFRVGKLVELATTGLDDEGAGVASLPGATVYVTGALAGERVLVRLEHASPHHGGRDRKMWGRCERVLSKSADRVAPACPAFGRCGGCPLQHLAYPQQLSWKRDKVVAALAPVVPEAEALVGACVPSPAPLGYRNQAKYVYGQGPEGAPLLGAYAPRSHTLVDLLGCKVVSPVLDRTAHGLRDLLAEFAVEPYDERTGGGLLRHLVLRCDPEDRVLVSLVTRSRPWPDAEAFAAAVLARNPQVVGVVRNLNDGTGNAIFGSEDIPLWGRPWLDVPVGATHVPVGPRAFLQVNFGTAARVWAEIRRAVAGVGPVNRLVDLYAGVGAIAFSVADLASDLVAIEENPAGTLAGTQAARKAGLPVAFFTGEVAARLEALGQAEVVILNPPRAGAGERVSAAVAAARPRLVAYLSCSPKSLARDLVTLVAQGLEPVAITPFDMHPHTPHVEVLLLLR